MDLYREYLEGEKDFSSYADLKAGFSLHVSDNFNFAYDVVDVYAEKEPKKIALVWCDDLGEKRVFTFSEIAEESKKVAVFLSVMGIGKGDTVLLMLRRRYEWWFLMVALCRIGAIAVPATDQLHSLDIEYRLNAAKIKMVISYENLSLQAEIEKAAEKAILRPLLVSTGGASKGWLNLRSEVSSQSADFLLSSRKASCRSKDTMLIYFTSGTSGQPKMVSHSFSYPVSHIVTAKFWHGCYDGGLHFSLAETGWAKAVWGKLYGQWLCGSAVFAYDMTSFKPGLVLEKIEKYHVTTFCAPPTVYRYLVRHSLSQKSLASVTRFTTAGEALNAEVYDRFLELTGKKIHEGYGQTESAILCANFLDDNPRPGSMGRSSPAYEVDVIDDEGKIVPCGTPGEIAVKIEPSIPFGLLSGYYGDKDLTEATFCGGYYRTGDVATVDDEGYFWYLGRKDDIIKTSGYRISPFEVESILHEHPAVMECAVTGVPDKERGYAVKATVVLSPGFFAGRELEIELLSFAKERSALYKCPREIVFASELPKTISGKIRRVELRSK